MHRLLLPSSRLLSALIPTTVVCGIQAASAVTVTYPIYFGHTSGTNTLVNLGTGGGGGTNGTRLECTS